MGTSETQEIELGVCPCGKGHTVAHYTTPDGPWGRPFTTYGVRCPNCSNHYVAEGQTLYSRAEYDVAKEARSQSVTTSIAIDKLAASWVDAYFSQFSDKPATVQLSHMRDLGITGISITNFRRDRKQQRPFSKLCSPHRNPSWLLSVVNDVSVKQQIEALFTDLAASEKVDKDTSAEMERVSIPRFERDVG